MRCRSSIIFAQALVLVLSIVSCDIAKIVVSDCAVDITPYSALLRGSFYLNKPEEIEDYGFLYGESRRMELTISKNSLLTDYVRHFEFCLSNLVPSTKYYYCSYVTIHEKTYFSEVKSFTTLDAVVDLGLSVKWSVINLGAIALESHGKSCRKEQVENEVFDNQWRLPSISEWEELQTKCNWKRVTKRVCYSYYMQSWRMAYTDVDGYQIKSNVEGYTDKSMFIPMLYGYWSSDPSTREIIPFFLTDQPYPANGEFGLRLVAK